jgi:hypothetical protein
MALQQMPPMNIAIWMKELQPNVSIVLSKQFKRFLKRKKLWQPLKVNLGKTFKINIDQGFQECLFL